MAQLKYVAFASVMLLACSFAAAIPFGFGDHWTEYNGTVIIDRANKSEISQAYYMALNGVDRTTFAVNQSVWLERFDLTKIYEYNVTGNYSPLNENKIAQMKVVKTNFSGGATTIYVVNATVNSYNEAEVHIYPEILLSRNYIYEIQVRIPHENGTMYHGSLDIKDYYTKTTINTTIAVKFFQRNPLDTLPPNNTDFYSKLSQGVVQRIHLKY